MPVDVTAQRDEAGDVRERVDEVHQPDEHQEGAGHQRPHQGEALRDGAERVFPRHELARHPALSAVLRLMADEVEDKTITYLFTRPVPRGAILIGKYLAYLACTSLVVLPSVMLVYFLLIRFSEIPSTFMQLVTDLGLLFTGLAVYGDWRTAVAYNNNNGQDIAQIATRLNIDVDLKITGTEQNDHLVGGKADLEGERAGRLDRRAERAPAVA